jgi:hypothetical protein
MQGDRPGPISFRTTRLTDHSLTHIDVLRAFLGIRITVEAEPATKTVKVTLG